MTLRTVVLAMTTALSFTAGGSQAQGVPTIDTTSLQQLIQQAEQMTKDFNVQVQKLNTLKNQLETELKQLTQLEDQLKSLVESAGVGELLATVEDFKRLKGSIEAPIESIKLIASGDFKSMFPTGSELEGRLRSILSSYDLDEPTMTNLSESKATSDRGVAAKAGASALLSVAAEESHQQAGESLERLQTLVSHVDGQQGVKAAIDLNTRVTAELGVILTQMWRLEAASGVSAGQLGVVDAATLAAERKFRTMGIAE